MFIWRILAIALQTASVFRFDAARDIALDIANTIAIAGQANQSKNQTSIIRAIFFRYLHLCAIHPPQQALSIKEFVVLILCYSSRFRAAPYHKFRAFDICRFRFDAAPHSCGHTQCLLSSTRAVPVQSAKRTGILRC